MTPRRLKPVPPAPPRWWQGWAPAVFLFSLVGGLCYASYSARQLDTTVHVLESQLATQAQTLKEETQERQRLLAENDRLVHIVPTERIIVEPCVPPRRAEKRVTPVFGRETQFSGSAQ